MRVQLLLVGLAAMACATYAGLAAWTVLSRQRQERPQGVPQRGGLRSDAETAALRAEVQTLRKELQSARSGAGGSTAEADEAAAAAHAAAAAAAQAAGGAKDTSGSGRARCVWTRHPGVTLGAVLPTGQWRHCAGESEMCRCRGGRRVRFAGGTPRHLSVREGQALICEERNFPSVGSDKRICECEEPAASDPVTLLAAQARCASIGPDLCEGVSCTAEGDQCTPRDGTKYLLPNEEEDSYTRDCVDPAAQAGGGHSGKHEVEGKPTIFVSMAAFRDIDAQNTLVSMFEKAKYPHRIFVGVVCQVHPGDDPPCVPPNWAEACQRDLFCPSDQVRLRTFNAAFSEGPTHARGLAAAMYRGEDFFLMMDAHNRFVQDWEEKLVSMHRSCPSERCVLSHYPQGLNMSDPNNPHPLFTPPGTRLEDDQQVAYLCNGEWHERSLIKNFRAMMIPVGAELHPQPYSGAGLLFGPGRMIIEVPFDPHLRYVWDGEEFLYNARLWTWGYDLYSPYDNVLFHHYNRPTTKHYHAEDTYRKHGYVREGSSYRRLQYILGMTHKGTNQPLVDPDTQEQAVIIGLPKYGLGTRRNMSEFWRYSRGDPNMRTGDQTKFHNGFFCTRCRGSVLVPGCMYTP
eukprot:TRINITY_DN3907_c0_g1_i1.p1 TRINITY_DN3907_c0_g1~~TRINITY_DN3907_c0_g1_i1.p1  ORF type:complete len:657 (+),score=170.84 TRINITY_DN3907_c0_g1_i1:92-1972(+)